MNLFFKFCPNDLLDIIHLIENNECEVVADLMNFKQKFEWNGSLSSVLFDLFVIRRNLRQTILRMFSIQLFGYKHNHLIILQGIEQYIDSIIQDHHLFFNIW